MKKLLHLLVGLWLLAGGLSAQQISYYYCDFENAAEVGTWTLNKRKAMQLAWTNLWYVGKEGACEGDNGLYISADNGKTAAYTNTDNTIIAYRRFDLEAGEYDIALDWRSMGESTNAFLAMCWIPEAVYGEMQEPLFTSYLNSDIGSISWISDYLVPFDGGRMRLFGSSVWEHSIAHITADGKPHYLMLVWVNNTNSTLLQPGACVDNIQLARNNCGAPANFSVSTEGHQVTVKWTSSAESFRLKYVMRGTGKVQYVDNIKSNEQLLTLEHGVYYIRLQVVCQSDSSVWYAFPPAIVFDSKCFNCLDLNAQNCWFSEETAERWQDNVLEQIKLDFGYQSEMSRHTIHYEENEYDRRTFNSHDVLGNPVEPLRTVPEGEIATVRIGSWEKTAHVARVSYDFVVDADEAAVLTLKYAAVLELPGHGELDQPRFTLDIINLDTGEPLSGCTTIDFAATSANAGAQGWYFGMDDTREIVWKDWTSVGLNMTEFDGANVRVMLTVYGCTAEIHYGYAYFTLSCTSGHIEGINCGDVPTNEFIAPEGFNYEWYRADKLTRVLTQDGLGNPLNKDSRVFGVDYQDTTLYTVKVLYRNNPDDCNFSLNASAVPRYGIPEFTCSVKTDSCRNRVSFHNTSHIRTKNIRENTYRDLAQRPDGVIWNFGDVVPETTEWEPVVDFPLEGGTYTVTLHAFAGLCDSIMQMDIVLPRIGDVVVRDSVQVCDNGNPYQFHGRMYITDTVVTERGLTWAGCDSVYEYKIGFVKQIITEIDTTITDEQSYKVGDKTYTATGDYTDYFTSSNGCDSVVQLHLRVVPVMRLDVDSVLIACADETQILFSWTPLKGVPSSCELRFDEAGHAVGLQDTLVALGSTQTTVAVPMPVQGRGYYQVTLHFDSYENGQADYAQELVIRYPASLIEQRWNNVLGVCRAGYGANPDWEFESYQWYKNGRAIADATGAYYYEEPQLDMDAYYAVELLEAGRQRPLLTCQLQPRPVQQGDVRISTDSSARKLIKDGRFLIERSGRFYDLLGRGIGE